eukprot:m.180660 g.180660  ORF g.180660 m.180660 type:complete len:168 (-) comp21468_c3_seq4:29-532(-)
MAGRIIAQIIVAGVQVVGRAFAQAYREAAATAAKGGAQAAANAAKSGAKNGAKQQSTAAAAGATQARGMMELEEARKILHVDSTATWEEALDKFDHLFKINDKKNGGSFYLQSKVYRAKERLELEYPPEVREEVEKLRQACEEGKQHEAKEAKNAKDSSQQKNSDNS